MKYDIIVIDEVEQVLGHFLSETLGEKRRGIFQIFVRLLREARQVVLLDADLSWPTFKTMELIRSMGLFTQVGEKPKATPVRFYLNDWTDRSRSINIYESHDHLVHELKDAILSGQRVFVTSNSKRKIDALEQVVLELENASDTAIPHISITSANSKSAEIQTFIKHIKSEALQYQVILSSPSLGTGVDITFENNASEIDRVFGFFEARVTSHYEIDQQLARVRHPKQIDVWISPQRFNFETQSEVVVDDLLHSDLIYSVEDGMHWTDRQTLADKDPFLAVAALIVSKDRASKNRLKLNFIEHKHSQDWEVKSVLKDDKLAGAGLALLEEGKLRSINLYIERLLEAKTLTEEEFDSIKERAELGVDVVSTRERYQYDRTRLELFYREEISAELIRMDDLGRLRDQVYLYSMLTDPKEVGQELKDAIEHPQEKKISRARVEVLKDRRVAAALLREILSTTPIFEKGMFLSDVEFSKLDLEPFITRSLQLRKFVEGQFGTATRQDIDKKPTQQIAVLLQLVGLKNKRVRKQRIGPETRYYYRIDSASLKVMKDISERRETVKGWQFVNQKYGFDSLPFEPTSTG